MEDTSQQPLNTNFTPPGLNDSGQQFHPGNSGLKPKKSKKKVFLSIFLILLLIGGGLAAYFFYFKKDAAAPSAPAAQEQEQKPTGPISLIYSNGGDTTAADYNLKLNSIVLASNQKTTFDVKDKSLIKARAVHGQQIAATSAPGSEQQKTEKILYSKDNGVTYEQIYETKESGQITDIKFSSDGSTIIFGLLPTESGKNTLTEINPATKETTDIFTTDSAGVLIYGYGKDKKVLYTKSACYNCEGGPMNDIYSYDIATKKETILVSSKNTMEGAAVKSDLSSLLYVDVPTKPSPDGVGTINTGPYTIKSFDLETNKSTDITSLGEANKPITILVGYTDEGKPYYTDDKNIYVLNTGGEPSTLFTSTKNILAIHYVSSTEVYTSLGSYDAFTVEKFNISDQKSTSLLEGKSISTDIIGITTNN